MQLVRIRFLESAVSSTDVYTVGKEYDVPAKLAMELIRGGIAVKVSGSIPHRKVFKAAILDNEIEIRPKAKKNV